MSGPNMVLLAGPNGAGKTTAAPAILRDALKVSEFVNADVLARGLSAFAPESVSFAAGRVMMTRLKNLAAQRASFAFETTLASRVFGPWIQKRIASGYLFHLVFIWLANAELAVQRVVDRGRKGGYTIPESVIRRRYEAGLWNFFRIYRPLATTWRLYDNSESLRLIASGFADQKQILDERLWLDLERRYGKAE